MTSRRIWSQREDEVFRRIAGEYEPKNWAVIAKRLASEFGFKKRTGKQCRERWFNHLDPSISKKGWTRNEEELLLNLHKTYGNRWTQIAEQMPGRSDNSIKNYFYSTVRRNLRRMGKLLGSKNSTGLMREIKPSTMTRVFGSLNEEQDQKLLDCLQEEGLTKTFLKESCESIRNEIIQFSYYKPKKHDMIDAEDKEKYQKVFWLLKKVNEIYERVREEQKSHRTEKQIFRSFYQEMNRSDSEEEEPDLDSLEEEEHQEGASSEHSKEKQPSPIITSKSKAREIKNSHPLLQKQIALPVHPEVALSQMNQPNQQDFGMESSGPQRANPESTLQNIVEFAEEEEFHDPDFNIEIGDEGEKQAQCNGLEIDMSKMSFRSPACNYGTPVSQVNFFKSPRSVRITCLNDFLMRMSGSLGRQENEAGYQMNNSGSLKELEKSYLSNYFFHDQNNK